MLLISLLSSCCKHILPPSPKVPQKVLSFWTIVEHLCKLVTPTANIYKRHSLINGETEEINKVKVKIWNMLHYVWFYSPHIHNILTYQSSSACEWILLLFHYQWQYLLLLLFQTATANRRKKKEVNFWKCKPYPSNITTFHNLPVCYWEPGNSFVQILYPKTK